MRMDISAQEEGLVLEDEVGICLGLRLKQKCVKMKGLVLSTFSPSVKEGPTDKKAR